MEKAEGEHFLRKQIYLAPEEAEALKKAAREEDVTQSEIIRRALRRYLELYTR